MRVTATVDSRSSQKRTGRGIERLEVAHEGPRRLRARPLGAVHVQRQAEDEAADTVALDQSLDLLDVGGELDASDRLERRGDAPFDVREGEADRLGAEVDPDKAGAGRKTVDDGSQIGVGGVHRGLLWSRNLGDAGC